MPLENIIDYIKSNTDKERSTILEQAKKQERLIIKQAWQERDNFYKRLLAQEKESISVEKRRVIVNETIEGKKRLLKRKQELIDVLFFELESALKKTAFKKKQVLVDRELDTHEDTAVFLKRVRFELEPQILKVLFVENKE
ncbi:MAG: hypothetical protein P9L96_02040 [Candidatus Gygaella obscura]|nr:hypothetical protein [Candidatus Gygaella obscura]